MFYDPSTSNYLKPWLIRTLEPICDAEPGALADYILALLKHNVSENEMKKELAVQLDEFLEKECSAFLETLFTVLRTKSYLPYASSPTPNFNSKPLDAGIPIPLDALIAPPSPDRGVKRGLDNEERDGRPPAKGPRLNSDGQFSRYSGHGRGDGRSSGGWNQRNGSNEFADGGGPMNMFGNMGMMAMGMPNQQRGSSYQPPDHKRGICRDYHNHGYCARGAHCKYSHGDDAVIPPMYMGGPQIAPGLPFYPMFPGMVPFAGAAYDPHEARMDMRPMGGRNQGRALVMARTQQGEQSLQLSGELPVIQDLTPMVTSEATGESPSSPSTPAELAPGQDQEASSAMEGMMSTRSEANGVDMDVSRSHRGQNFRGGARGGRGRGTFGGDAQKFRPEKRNDKTLVVEKIPEDKLSLEHVNNWFKRFGTVTNVAIDAQGSKALVSFSTHEEAHAAWKSEDAVFNNRFVKIFWHRPLEGHGLAGARALAASAPLVANMASRPIPQAQAPSSLPPTAASTSTAAASTTVKKTNASMAASDIAAKQALLEQQISEQKSLMASLETATSEGKKEILARLRKLNEEMKPVTPQGAPSQSDSAEKEKERLDKELELHGTKSAEESTEDLKAKLERLKAEAASLGITDEHAPTSYYGGGYRSHRGRGRGMRGGFRGALRGGPLRGSMKLDNRPKKLVIKGADDAASQAVREWYEASGQLESVETQDEGDLVVSFRTRVGAEQALAKGQDIPGVGTVQIAWFTSKPNTSIPQQGNHDMAPSRVGNEEMGVDADVPPHLAEEEVVVGNWGGDEEDAMGMF